MEEQEHTSQNISQLSISAIGPVGAAPVPQEEKKEMPRDETLKDIVENNEETVVLKPEETTESNVAHCSWRFNRIT